MVEKFVGDPQVRSILVNRTSKEVEDEEGADTPPEITYNITLEMQYVSNKWVQLDIDLPGPDLPDLLAVLCVAHAVW